MSKWPKFGINLLLKIYKAVDLPIPLVPTSPITFPSWGMGKRYNLKEFLPKLWIISLQILCEKLFIYKPLKGHMV
jgi:hypothetical protein